MKFRLPVVLLLAMGPSAAAFGQEAPTPPDPAPATKPPAASVQSGPRIDPQRVFLDQNRRQPGWMVTGTGLQYRILKRAAPTAPQPDSDDTVRVNYEGKLIDGTVFDSTMKRGQPASLALHQVIDGWREGIPMMRVGEIWEFVIPHRLGYGPVGRGPIPGGATLIFQVELVGFDPGKAPEQEPRYVSPETEKRKAQEKAKEKKER